MGDLVRAHVDLSPGDLQWLHRLVAEWQLLADLSFSDLVLWVPVRTGDGFLAVAQMRPTTGPTAYHDDKVGQVMAASRRPQLGVALGEARIVREGEPVWVQGVPVREEAVPVRRGSRVIAVIARDTNLGAPRTPSRLENTYLQTAGDLAVMVAEGRFPVEAAAVADDSGPRVGDGLIRLDPSGVVLYASPNALSAYRRLGVTGDLEGEDLSALTTALAPARGPVDEPVGVVATGRVSRMGDVETPHAVVQLRAIPLNPGGRHIGAIVLVHDVTELRRRERALMSKDATIREIHHRVKNNLQTVAALLRLQSRRLASPEARLALEESMRRVTSIALVHETLSATLDEAVDFDAIADRVVGMVTEMAPPDRRVLAHREGSFGVLPAEVATPLAMVLTELLQNAVEHAFDGHAGQVRVEARQRGGRLSVQVTDDGIGLPAGFSVDTSDRLGLQIVRTLVEGELGGTLTLETAEAGGTRAALDLPLPIAG
ncbi:MAG TPA: histidine kinase N-terminal domain-containing protein [Mycobacteriales bacterium]|jgi:two-component sensor histidine kinase|nr:histidine kinase N-terminal domain-containing protein [Mycobacteriales bacterium]